MDRAAARGRAARSPGAGTEESALLKRVRASRTSTTRRSSRLRAGCCRADAPSYEDLGAAASSAWRACSSSRSARTAAVIADYDAGLRSAAGRASGRATSYAGRRAGLRPRPARHGRARLTTCSDVPLDVHARYQREEVLAALDYASCAPSRLVPGGRAVRRGPRRRRLLRHAAGSPRRTSRRRRCTATTPSARRSSTGSPSRRPRSPLRPASATSVGGSAPCCSSCASSRRTTSARRRTSSSARPRTAARRRAAHRRSPGDCTTPCRRLLRRGNGRRGVGEHPRHDDGLMLGRQRLAPTFCDGQPKCRDGRRRAPSAAGIPLGVLCRLVGTRMRAAARRRVTASVAG